MNTNELIEQQISQARTGVGCASDRYEDLRESQSDDRVRKCLGELVYTCERLLQIVQNQQLQIEELQKRVSDLEPQTAMGLLDEIIKRGQAGEFYKGEKK